MKMVDIHINQNINNVEKYKTIISNILSRISNTELYKLDDIYLTFYDKPLFKLSKYISFSYDGWYYNKLQMKRSSITINIKEVQRKEIKLNKLFLFFIKCQFADKLYIILISILLFPVFISLCIRDKNIKYWYLFTFTLIPKKYRLKINDKEEKRIIYYFLFYLGIHHWQEINPGKRYVGNINAYEFASKYRNRILWDFFK